MLLQSARKALAIVSTALLVSSSLTSAATANGYKDGRVVLGYIPLQRQTGIPWDSLTHANIAFAFASDRGNITFEGTVVNKTMTSEQHAREVIADGQKHNVKMLVAVGGQGNFSKHLAGALSTPKTLSAFVSNTVDFVAAYKLDGIDCDFEFPENLTEATNLLTVLQGIRKGMDGKFGKGKKLLTMTLYNHPFLGPGVPSMDYKPFYETVDYAYVMSYDYFGNWGDYSAPNAPMLDVPFFQGSFRNTTDAWLDAGWPANKLVAGLPFYGHSSVVATDMSKNLTNQYVPIKDHKTLSGPVSEIEGTWTWKDLRDPKGGALSDMRTARSGWVRVWDKFTLTPWLFRKSDHLYIGYDDEDSLGVKLDYSLRRGLAGAFIWELGYDYNDELISYVKDFIQQSDDGMVAENCAPSDSDLDSLFDESRDPNFFNYIFNYIALRKRDGDKPMCQFVKESGGDKSQESTGAAPGLSRV
ncbi:hypothetical protein FBU59_005121, partial [Linderina macrospora]